jgi:glycosyltransferase involved in cell wall biosynthesis
MDLVYDNIIFSLQQTGGISTYWSQLIKRLQRDKVAVKFISGANNNIGAKEVAANSENIIECIRDPVLLSRFFNPSLKSIQVPFVFHSSYNRVSSNKKAVNILTVHDFIHERFYSGPRKTLHCGQKKIAIQKSRKVICISENTRQDLLNYYPTLSPENIKVIYNGVSEQFQVLNGMPEQVKPFLIFIGSRQPYKNFNFVVQLVTELKEFDLYIVGKDFSPREMSLLKNIEGRFKLFTNIGNTQLNELYNSAFALLYPSFYEGFGLPILEAMKAGLPFIALNASSIPEVAGNAGELLEHIDIDAAKEALNRIENCRSHYITRGLKQSQKFSWEKCYQETLNLYYEAYNE